MFRTIRNLRRLLRIARILARHDALFMLEELGVAQPVVLLVNLVSRRRATGRPGERLARALQKAGPSFIKLGQALSTRSDLLGEQLAADLSQLQDRLPPFSGTEAIEIIEQEFGQSLDALYSSFDETPVAAASIAQVHFAVTTDGREVAVKVLRPGIERAFANDLDLFLWMAELIEATRPELRRLKPVVSIRTLADTVRIEMDLRFEAAAAAELAENFAGDADFHIPAVDWTRTAQRVLTTERVYGIPFDHRDELIKAGHDPEAVMEKASRAFFNQVFRDGFFHADLHPGNLFVCDDGSIAAVDFGIMGRLSKPMRRHLGELLTAFLMRDYRRAAEVHFEAGWVPAHQSVDAFTQATRSIAEPILDKPQNEISMAHLLGQLFKIADSFEMETQPELLLLQKTMLVAEGGGRKLSPDSNMWFLARPLMEEWLVENLGPQALVADALAEAADALRRLPTTLRQIERSAATLASGELRLHPETVRALRGGDARARYWPYGVIAALAMAVVYLLLE